MEANAVIADAPQGHIVLVGEVPVVPVQPGAVPEGPVLVAPPAAAADPLGDPVVPPAGPPFPGPVECPYGTQELWEEADVEGSPYQAANAAGPLSKRLFFAHSPQNAGVMCCMECFFMAPHGTFHRACHVRQRQGLLDAEPPTSTLVRFASGVQAGAAVHQWSQERAAERMVAQEAREAAEAGRAVAALEELTAARAEVHRLRLLATQAEGAAVSMAGAGHSLQARGGAFGDGGSGLRASAGGAAVAGSCDPTGRASGLDSAAVVEVVTAGGSEASSVLGYLEALHTDIQALTAKALANMSGADRDAACQAAMGRLSQWALAFLLGIPQGTQALALLGYRAVERGAGSGAGAPAGLPVVSPVTQVSVIQAASRLNTLVSEVRAWVEAATKGGDALAGGVKVVSLGEDMQSYPVGTVISKGTKEFIRLPGSSTGVLLGKDGGASEAPVVLVLRLGISSLHVGCRGVQDHLGRQASGIIWAGGVKPEAGWELEVSRALQQGLVPPLMGARVGEGRWLTTFNAYVMFVTTSHDEADPLRTDVRALQKSMPRHATLWGMDIVADTWEATAAAFNAEVRAALSMFSLEVSAVSADFATGARGLPMSSFSVLFQNELIIQTHKARIRTEAGKVSTVGRVVGAITVKGVAKSGAGAGAGAGGSGAGTAPVVSFNDASVVGDKRGRAAIPCKYERDHGACNSSVCSYQHSKGRKGGK